MTIVKFHDSHQMQTVPLVGAVGVTPLNSTFTPEKLNITEPITRFKKAKWWSNFFNRGGHFSTFTWSNSIGIYF